MSVLTVLTTSIASSAAEQSAPQGKASRYLVYVGTYTQGKSKGIYRYVFDTSSGELTSAGEPTESENPSFLVTARGGRFLYACNETSEWAGQENSGGVSAYRIDPKTGGLTFLNSRATRGGAPCHVEVDAKGRALLVANYTGGSVISYPLKKNGSIGEAASFIQHTGSSVLPRQKGPHAHCINLDPANRFAFVADLGLDEILIYNFDGKTAGLTPHDPPAVKVPPGSGPRHFAIHPTRKFAYAINEIGNTVSVFAYDEKRGRLKSIQRVPTLPEGFKGTSHTAEVFVHPSGKFLYGSNRGHDSIVVYRIDEKSGKLTLVEHEGEGIKVPRSFGIDPSGQFVLVASQAGDNVRVFRVDQKSGALAPTDHRVEVPMPVCVIFLPWK
jgi:6-phosphogluconolactonase